MLLQEKVRPMRASHISIVRKVKNYEEMKCQREARESCIADERERRVEHISSLCDF